jgi:hypothetical protein
MIAICNKDVMERHLNPDIVVYIVEPSGGNCIGIKFAVFEKIDLWDEYLNAKRTSELNTPTTPTQWQSLQEVMSCPAVINLLKNFSQRY